MRRKKPDWEMGRLEDKEKIWALTHNFFTNFPLDPRERLCYRPEENGRVVAPSGEWVFVLMQPAVAPEHQPIAGCGYWAVPWPNAKEGYDGYGRYSVSITLPNGNWVRLWPYEYGVLPDDLIQYALQHGELIYHPFETSLALNDMPEVADMVGALMLDGLTIHEAVYELTCHRVRGASKVKVPAPGWFEATFIVPWGPVRRET